jgi:TonB-linked SusC/RagA family outer membrane protein
MATRNLKKHLLIFALIFISVPLSLCAQNGRTDVTGMVRNEDGDILQSVTVIVKNVRNNFTAATQTDSTGVFNFFSLPSGSGYSFSLSYVGYETQNLTGYTLKPDANFSMLIKLKELNRSLNEIVVIGYGSVKKSDLTGSVATISEKDFNKGIATNTDQLIQGKAPGVTILQSNAQPGGATRIQIRGITSLNASNEPLYVIDGMPIDNIVLNTPTTDLTKNAVFSPPPPNPLNTINPADIASIEILKDASATAIYGSRGANGVVLITTRRGTKGKTSVSYNGSIGMQDIAKTYDLPDAFEYASAYNSYYDFYKTINPTDPIFNNSVVHKFSDADINGFKNGGGTDWYNVLTRQGIISNNQASVSGGSENSTYYASLGYLNHKGVIALSNLERISARLNLTQKIARIFEYGINMSVATSKTGNIPIGTADAGDSRGGATSGALFWAPTIPAYAPDGTVNVHPYTIQNSNPVGLKLVDNTSEQNRMIVTSYLQANLTRNFFAKVTGGYDKALDNSRSFVPAETKNSLAAKGEATQGSYINTTKLLNLLLQYKAEFNKHRIDITGGTDYQTFKYESVLAKASGFSTSSFGYNNMYAATTQNTFSGKNTSTIFSYLGRINYAFDNRFLLTGSFRYDGSSKFADGRKWGFFPSGALAWKIGNEKFIKDFDVFSDLKLRLSYGKTGNQAIGSNNSQPLLGSTQVGTIGDTRVFPIGPTSPGNKDLRWETTTQQNIGLDFGIWNNRLTGSIDYYKTVTTDLLLSFQIPSTSGFNSIVKNAGAIQNNGIELSLNSQNLKGKLEWNTNFNISYNKNKWKDRAGLPFAPQEEFGPVYGIYGYIVDGIWQTGDNIASSSQPLSRPGQFRFRDINGRDNKNQFIATPDGKLNPDDRVLLGNSFPKTNLGITNNFSYKSFSLNFFIQGLFGFKIYNQAKALFENPYNFLQLSGVNKAAMNFWTSNNTGSMVPSGQVNSYGGSVNSLYVEKGDFVRLKNFNLSYKLPFRAAWFQTANVYINLDNVLLITNYSGLDPETANPVNSKSGSEHDVYPNVKTYSLGFNISF